MQEYLEVQEVEERSKEKRGQELITREVGEPLERTQIGHGGPKRAR